MGFPLPLPGLPTRRRRALRDLCRAARAAGTWSGDAPLRYHSSPGVTRSFCGKCGTSLTYEGERWPGELHILAATLDDPGLITPQAHVYVGQKLPWVHLSDGLPRFRTLPREGPPLAD